MVALLVAVPLTQLPDRPDELQSPSLVRPPRVGQRAEQRVHAAASENEAEIRDHSEDNEAEEPSGHNATLSARSISALDILPDGSRPRQRPRASSLRAAAVSPFCHSSKLLSPAGGSCSGTACSNVSSAPTKVAPPLPSQRRDCRTSGTQLKSGRREARQAAASAVPVRSQPCGGRRALTARSQSWTNRLAPRTPGCRKGSGRAGESSKSSGDRNQAARSARLAGQWRIAQMTERGAQARVPPR